MKRILLFLLLACSLLAKAQSDNSLSGTITGKDSSPLSGASIHVLNTNLGTITDGNGKFEINNLQKGKYSLEITAVGYASTKLETTIGNGANDLTVELHDAFTQLDAVVVTAQKQEEDAQRIASSVSVISSKQVQDYRLWNASEISAIIPNLYSSNPGDNRNVTSIRGITSSSYDPAVATYIDGVNQFGLDTYIAQLFDIERIEVLRGPQGTLYGRNAMGGVINIITKQPTNATSGFGEMTFGNYGQMRHGFGIKTSLIKNKLFFGASGVYDQTNGFYTNESLTDTTHFDKKHSITGNYYLKYIANSRWAFTLNVKHNQNRNNGVFPLATGDSIAIADPYKVNYNALAKMIDNVYNGSLTIAHTGRGLNFTSQSTYQSNYRYYNKPLDADFSPYDIITVVNDYGNKWNTVKVFTQEFKFTSPASTSSPLKWTAGSYFYHQKSPVKQALRYGEQAYYGGYQSDSTALNTTNATNTGIALFGQASYRILQKLEMTFGVRYDYEHKKSSVLQEFQADPATAPNPAYTIRDAGSGSYGAFSPKAAVAYYFTEHSQVYGSYNRGFRTGGLTQAHLAAPLTTYKPEYSNNFEVGLKNTLFNNHLMANLSVFYIDVKDSQVPTFVLPDAITVIKNTGSLTSKGIELELKATPLKGLQFDYNWGINKAIYNSFQVAEGIDLKGRRQIFTPAYTSMLAAQYQIGFGVFKILGRAEWMYFGKQYFDVANAVSQSGHGLVNTKFGVSYKTIDLTIWTRNLLSARYINYTYDYGGFYPSHLGNPKTYGITLRVSF